MALKETLLAGYKDEQASVSAIRSSAKQNLESLELNKVRVRSWPNLSTPWMLKRLVLFSTGIDKNDLFKGKKLHLMLPKLESLSIFLNPGEEMTVPEKSMFKGLSEISLCGGGTFRRQSGDVIVNPKNFLSLWKENWKRSWINKEVRTVCHELR